MNKKSILIAFVFGIIVTVFTFHTYTVYQLRSTVMRHDVVLGEVVNFINNSIKASQASTATPVK